MLLKFGKRAPDIDMILPEVSSNQSRGKFVCPLFSSAFGSLPPL